MCRGVWVAPDHSCGTVACFAGWACMLDGMDTEALIRANVQFHVAEQAANRLGLSLDEAVDVFDPSNTLSMLELMVKDLVNGESLRDRSEYWTEAFSEYWTEAFE